MNIAADDSVHPNAGVLADDDVANELGGVVDIGGFGKLGSGAFVRADHGYQMLPERERSTYHGAVAEVSGAEHD